MLFKKKADPDEAKKDELLRYLSFRDSLTGQMNKAFAVKEYGRLCSVKGYGAVMVRLSGCDNMPLYKAEAYIKDAGDIISRIYDGEIARIEYGDFLMFTDKYEEAAEKIGYFTDRLCTDDKSYAVAADALDSVEDFDRFFNRIKRHIGVVEISNINRRRNLAR